MWWPCLSVTTTGTSTWRTSTLNSAGGRGGFIDLALSELAPIDLAMRARPVSAGARLAATRISSRRRIVSGAREGFAEIEVGIGIARSEPGGGAEFFDRSLGVSQLKQSNAQIIVGRGRIRHGGEGFAELGGGVGFVADGVIGEAQLVVDIGARGVETKALVRESSRRRRAGMKSALAATVRCRRRHASARRHPARARYKLR